MREEKQEVWSRSKLILLIFLFILSLVLLIVFGSGKSLAKNDHSKVNLHKGSLVNFISFPNELKPKWHNANWLTVYLKYPSMLANKEPNFSLDESVRLMINVVNLSGNDKVKTFLRHVYDENGGCAVQACYVWKLEEKNKFIHFRDGLKNDPLNKQLKAKNYYLFTAYDGQQILLEDSGSWSSTYRINRNIDDYFLLEYQFRKKIATNIEIESIVENDLEEIDRVITEFIKNKIDLKRFRKDLKNAY